MGEQIVIEALQGGLAVDDRGRVSFVNDFDFKNVKRFYQVENHEVGYIRAWHAHEKEGKYVYVPKGAALVGTIDLGHGIRQPANEPQKFILAEEKPTVLWIPPGYANGFQNLRPNTVLLFFSTSTLEESQGDDTRYPYDKWNIWEKDYR